MKTTTLTVIPLLSLLLFYGNNLTGEDTTLQQLPPVVIRTSPVAGDNMVDPSLKKIIVTFSQTMTDKSWSFVMADKESFPQLTGKPSYEKGMKTCVLNVELEPDKTYVIWINSEKYMNFKGENGKSAVPYLLSFRTAGKEFMEKKKAAVECTEQWLALLADKKYAESWTSAADFFHTRIKQKVWERQIKRIYANFGAVNSRKLISAHYVNNLPNTGNSECFILHFATSFANKPKAFETITPMLDSDGKWKISGYYIK
jgi:RNA polymerase sigma-70 factor (ECF subfamily)